MKTQADLLEELRLLRRRVAELELAASQSRGDTPTPFPADDETVSPLLQLEERQRAYARLLKQTKLLQAMLDDVGDGIVVCDQKGRFLQFNPAAVEILGRAPFNTSTENWPKHYGLFKLDQTTHFPHDELPLVRATRGEETNSVEMFVRHENRPHGLWISVTARPVRDDSGQIRGGVAVIRDVTREKVAAAALEQKQQFLEHLLEAHERDRTLTAYEIHDGLVQDMTAALLHLDPVARAIPPTNNAATAALTTVRHMLMQGIDEGRRLIGGLRPPVLDLEGVLPAIALLTEQLSTADCQIDFEHDTLRERLPAIVEGNLYRIVQEALNNVARHSRAHHVRITVRVRDDQLHVVIRDDGIGFDVAAVPLDRYGLLGIRERAKLLGGECLLGSEPGEGTRISINIPLTGPRPLRVAALLPAHGKLEEPHSN